MRQRAFDVLCSAGCLLMASPLLTAIGLAVLLDSGRPILFRQSRAGRFGVPFTLLKFRSMAAEHGGGPLTRSGDPHVTRTGRFLRATKWDELPQLWNVLRGDMSMVGPRPELPQFVASRPQEFRLLLQARPGITDPASLAFHREAELLARYDDPTAAYLRDILPQKLRLSAEYLSRRTLRSDLTIIFRTLGRMGKNLAA